MNGRLAMNEATTDRNRPSGLDRREHLGQIVRGRTEVSLHPFLSEPARIVPGPIARGPIDRNSIDPSPAIPRLRIADLARQAATAAIVAKGVTPATGRRRVTVLLETAHPVGIDATGRGARPRRTRLRIAREATDRRPDLIDALIDLGDRIGRTVDLTSGQAAGLTAGLRQDDPGDPADLAALSHRSGGHNWSKDHNRVSWLVYALGQATD